MTAYVEAKVEPNPDGKGFKLILGDHELGVSKTDSDARLHMYAVNAALQRAFEAGRKDLERLHMKTDLELQLQSIKMTAEADLERRGSLKCVRCRHNFHLHRCSALDEAGDTCDCESESALLDSFESRVL